MILYSISIIKVQLLIDKKVNNEIEIELMRYQFKWKIKLKQN